MGSLFGCYLCGLCPVHADYVIQFRLFAIDGLRSKVPKSKFDWYKMSKNVRIALKTDLSGIKLHVKLFQ